MANNPQPAHITAEMWWFIEELERLEGPDTVFAGAWGRFKPGYHCDAWELWNHKVGSSFPWRVDYSTMLADDRVLGTPLDQFGAAVDWTFLSAQAGNFTNFKKYGRRIRAAHAARDPRLKGWREVLCQGDDDNPADGYDFVSWTQRTPDDTHRWHMHFSCLRKFLRTLSVFQAMISILRGETLAQWQAKTVQGGVNMKLFKANGDYWISRNDGETRETVTGLPDPGGMYALFVDAYPGCAYPDVDTAKWPKTDLALERGWTKQHLDGVFGIQIPFGTSHATGGGGGGDTGVHKHAISLHTAAQTLTSTTGPSVPA